MRILHYTLGFPPYRSGGLTRYAKDLMASQKEAGHQVTTFYPGGTNIFRKKCTLVHDCCMNGIDVFEMVNPLPVPLYYGIKSPQSMTDKKSLNEDTFERMLDRVSPNVLHIHTLMGLPKRYLEIAHERGIKIVYTSHDYFGLCPKVNYVDNEGVVCGEVCAGHCARCNAKAKQVWFLKVRNLKCLTPLKAVARRIMR